MLSRIIKIAILSMGLLASTADLAMATPPVECTRNPYTGECIIVVTDPESPSGTGTGTGTGTVTVAVTSQKCMHGDEEVPCKVDEGYWSNQRLCYVAATPPSDYPPSHPVWEGHYPNGAIYSCWLPMVGTLHFWSATPPPGGPAAPPDPRVLARQAIAMMNLRAVEIGIVPEPRPGSIGIIGLPTWMWVQNPTQSTVGPITRSASAGGFTVTATAKVTKTVWDMGDGTSVTCNGRGTPYADKYGKQSSPTCGHTYTRQGRYAVTATSYWTVAWAGIGQSGNIPLDFSRTTNITMGESQVLSQ